MAYPKSEDRKIQKLSNVLIKYAESKGVEFSFGGNVLYPVEALSFFGCLSLFIIEAKETYEKIYNNLYTINELLEVSGKKTKELTEEQIIKEEDFLKNQPKNKIFPINFQEKETETFFGFVPTVTENIPENFLIITYFTQYTLAEYLKIYKKNKMLLIDGKIPIDPLYDKMVKKINSQKIKIITSPNLQKNVSEN